MVFLSFLHFLNPKPGQAQWQWAALAVCVPVVAWFAWQGMLQVPQVRNVFSSASTPVGWVQLEKYPMGKGGSLSAKATPVPASAPPQLERELPAPQLNADQVAIVFSSKQPSVASNTVARTMTQPSAAPAEKLKFAIEALLKGPNPTEQAGGALTEIPKTTRLISIKDTTEGLLINLSDDFLGNEGAHSMQRRFEQLSKTVQAVENDRPVYLRINNQPVKLLGNDGLEIDGPLNQASLQQATSVKP